MVPQARFFTSRNMGIRILNTKVVFIPHIYFTMTNLVLFPDLRLLFLDLCLLYLDLVSSVLDLHQFWGVFHLGLSSLELGIGLWLVGLKTVYLTDWVLAFLEQVF